MIDGETVVDAHVHAPRLSTLKHGWLDWADAFSGAHPWRHAYDEDGNPVPERLDALLDAEGVDRALLFCEYSPRATGIQPIEDLLPLVARNPVRFRLVASVNPHLHHPLRSEAERQLDLGAVAVKLHPVHGCFSPADKELYPLYALCAERGVPVILHSGTSSFAGARSAFGNPELLVDVIEDSPRCSSSSHTEAGAGGTTRPPSLPSTRRTSGWTWPACRRRSCPNTTAALAWPDWPEKSIFGTDWPGVPGTAHNVTALRGLGLSAEVLRAVLSGNAAKVFPGLGV